MEAVLDAYERPYDPDNPVVGLDESPRQIVSEVRTGFVDRCGVQHYDYEYRREGVADLCMLVEPLAGRRAVLVRSSHTRLDYARALQHLAEVMYPTARRITVIEDNHAAHKRSALYEILPPEHARAIIERLEIIRTPVHGSWLNVAELEFSCLSRQALPNRLAHRAECEQRVAAWVHERNTRAVVIHWQFTTKDARIKLNSLYPTFLP